MNPPIITISGQAAVSGKPLFPHIDLSLPAGKWACLLGPSGVGKTSILRLLAGLDMAVQFTGNVSASDGLKIAPRTAYMAQTDLLFPWLSVFENIILGAKLRGQAPDRAQAQRIMKQMGIADHADKKPAALSGGQRQRVALARTLMEDCPVILLDEPFSALDAKTRADMQDLAFDALQGRTVLCVTHDPAEAARLSDTAYILQYDGLLPLPLPNSPAPRAIDAPETLQLQAQMLRILRNGAVS